MNLRQAYDGWSKQEQNRQLYVKTREAFRRAWFTLPTNKPCSWYTADVLALALAETRVVESDKVKAASVMIHVLTWANFAEPKWNPKPTFEIKDVTRLIHLPADELEKERERIMAAQVCQPERPKPSEEENDLDIDPVTALPRKAMAAEDAQPVNHGDCPTDSSAAEIEGTVPCDSHRPDKGETSDDADPLAGIDFDDPKEVADALMEQSARIMNDKPNEETSMEQKKPRGKAPKPVAQLDPETLKVVKVWPSRCEAERQTGACNIDRCIAKHRMSAGYYWCMPEEADTFKPNPLSGNQPKPAKPKQEVSPSSGDATRRGQSPCSPSATTHTGDSPRVSRPAASQALAVFTDDELLEELDRRGWEGELSRRQVVTIGAK